MKPLVSIIVPTCNRPELAAHCVVAALSQTYPAVEVLVGDDSPTDETRSRLQAAGLLERVRYFKNDAPLGQAGNVNNLIASASGERVVLIHDDDWLLTNAIEDLDRAWRSSETTIVCFGRQHLSAADGTIDRERSATLNAQYHRTADRTGVQAEPRFSALVGQVPNNGFMVDAAAAREVGYRGPSEVSHACDLDFGLRLAERDGDWVLTEEYVSVVRLSPDSILRSGGAAVYSSYADVSYRLIHEYPLPAHLEIWRDLRLREIAVAAAQKLLFDGNRAAAWEIMRSRHFGLLDRFSKHKAALLTMLVLPTAATRRAVARWSR